MRRAGPLLVAGVAGLALASPAWGGTYDVVTCDAAPGGANNAWTPTGQTSPHYDVETVCPSDGQADAGLRAWDKLSSPNAPAGTTAAWRFAAPSDTTIGTWRYRRWLGKDGDNDWDVHARLGDGTTLDSCTIELGFPSCEAGARPGQANERVAGGLSVTSLQFGITCAAASGFTCATGGATIHNAWAHLYASTVTLSENVPPSVSAPSGALVAGGWRRDVQTVSLSASDPLGIRETRVYVDGVRVATAARACDFTYSLPCVHPPCTPAAGQTCGDGSASASHDIDSRDLADGTRQVEVAAVDSANNEARSDPVTVLVDNTPPGFSISAPAGHTERSDLAVSWSSGDGSGSGVANREVEVSIDGGAWQGWLSGTAVSGATYAADPGHSYRFRGRATDASGLASAWAVTPAVHVTATAAGCPCPPSDDPSGASPDPGGTAEPPSGDDTPTPVARRVPALRLDRPARRGSRLAVRGTISRGASGTVTVTYSGRVRGRRIRTRRVARVRGGRFRASLRLSPRLLKARGRLLTVTYSGDRRYRARTLRTRRIR